MPDVENRKTSRLADAKAFGGDYDLVDVDEMIYMVDYFRRIGMHTSTGMGTTSISGLELNALDDRLCLGLTPWEFETLLNMSRCYDNGLSRHKDPESDPPYIADMEAYKEKIKAHRDAIRENLNDSQAKR